MSVTFGTPGAHGGKRCVSRGIQEGDHAVISIYMIGANMLGNTPSFTAATWLLRM